MNTETRQGRPPIYATEEERIKARRDKARVYQKAYLDVRRKRYRQDASHRTALVLRSREMYHSGTSYTPKGFGENRGKARSFGSPRKVDGRNLMSLSIPQMAAFIGVVSKVLSGWIMQGKFPRPKLTDESGVRVFTVKQADMLASVMFRGLKGRAAFRATDKDVIMLLHSTYQKT